MTTPAASAIAVSSVLSALPPKISANASESTRPTGWLTSSTRERGNPPALEAAEEVRDAIGDARREREDYPEHESPPIFASTVSGPLPGRACDHRLAVLALAHAARRPP